MDKTVFQGMIGFDTIDGNYHVTLEQENGYKVDLTARLAEIAYNLGKAQVGANYWIGPVRMTRDEMVGNMLRALYGGITAETERTTFYGSTMTGSWTQTETTLDFGGHDLLRELQDHRDEFLYMEVLMPAKPQPQQ